VKARLLFVSTLLLATVPLAFGQRGSSGKRTVEPPQIGGPVTQRGTQANEVLADVLAVGPNMPRGPAEILREYEDQMTLISQTFSAEMALIRQAVHQRQITREQADYLMQQGFQIAMMQYEVLNALHDVALYLKRFWRTFGATQPGRRFLNGPGWRLAQLPVCLRKRRSPRNCFSHSSSGAASVLHKVSPSSPKNSVLTKALRNSIRRPSWT
jgi:hypothetical protein